MKKGLVIPLVLTAFPAAAEDYQLFTEASVAHQEQFNENNTQYSVSAHYYFERKSTLGPFDQFEYINTTNNVGGFATRYDDAHSEILFGEYFIEELAFSGGVQILDGDHVSSSASAGYFVSDDLVVGVRANHIEGLGTDYVFSSSYNMQLNTRDYIGFTLNVNDHLDSGYIGAKYFNALSSGHYVVVNADYSTYISEFFSRSRRLSTWGVDAAYYVSKSTGFSLGWNDDEVLSAGARHFFTPHFALAIDVYHSDEKNAYAAVDYTTYVMSLSWQI